MNSIEQEIRAEKLQTNNKRRHYLKVLSISCLVIDLTAYILLESIDLAFTNFTSEYVFLSFFIVKILAFLIIAITIVTSMLQDKNTLLKISSLTYLILGLGLFFYLIISEMQASGDGMKPITDSKPAIYYSLFLNIIITLNIVAGVFRMLGSIFMMIYLKISSKIEKICTEINESLLKKEHEKAKSFDQECLMPNRYSNNYSIFSKDTRYSSMLEASNKSRIASIIATNKSSIISENPNNKIISSNMCKDLNIYINNQNISNNIHVHVYNCKVEKNVSQKASSRNNPKMATNTYESADMDKGKEDQLDSMYETPKKNDILLIKN